jgi:beta-N-acetylhexosaminidase
MKQSLYISFIIILFSSCATDREVIRKEFQPIIFHSGYELAAFMNSEIEWVERTLSRLTLEEKIGQMIATRAFTHYMSEESSLYRELVHNVQSLKVGGLVLFQGDVSEMALILNDMQTRADIPLLISADFEWGTAMRMRRGTMFPVAMALGATRDPELAFRTGQAIAREARAVGVHQNFAPVADINTNPHNPVINVRSFGEDTELVKEMAKAYADGLQAGGVISTAKHFPGHGDTDIDSHLDLPLLQFDYARLDSVELAPFRYVIDNGGMSIMTAHLAVPALGEDERRPATLSHTMLHTLLRNEMGFEGLVVTDALGMRAITRNYSPDEAALMAVEAGVDMLLVSPNTELVFQTLIDAVQSGRITGERIDRSVRRILMMKYWAGLHVNRYVDIPGYRSVVGNDDHIELAREIARRSVTLVRNENDVLPLEIEEDTKILVVVIADRENQNVAVTRPNAIAPFEPVGEYFIRLLRAWHGNIEVFRLDPRSNRIDFDSLMVKVSESDIVIGAAHVHARSSQGDIVVPDEMRRALVSVGETNTPYIIISFGDPYFIRNVPNVQAYLCAYSSAEASVEAVVETIIGVNNPSGRLPVTIPGIAPFGTGLSYTDTILIDEIRVEEEEEVPAINID